MDPESLAKPTAPKEDVFDYYVSPTESLQRDRTLAEEEARESLAALFWLWERLRIIYNATLFVVVLLIVLGFRLRILGNEGFYVSCILGAFMANVCYCTGFPLTIYAQRLGFKGRSTMLVLFALGLLLSVGFTGIVCLSYPNLSF